AKPANPNWMALHEGLPPGANQEWATWKSLSRLRIGVGRSKNNLAKWHYLEESSTMCDCGAEQTTMHLYTCPQCPASYTEEELPKAKDQWISTFLMLQPLNTVLHVEVTPTIKLFVLLFHNCNFATVMNHNVNI
ncbi:hypothetical protein, partial [Pseudomonas syringae]|uniref:hypothetical protein n=1 Tax=Pseudomonas syringae TaxID=317 RepID=UPI0034D779B0